jgi:hypothetical protein
MIEEVREKLDEQIIIMKQEKKEEMKVRGDLESRK